MNKAAEYSNHASSITGIYETLGTVLDAGDKKWIQDVFAATAYIDDFLDTIDDEDTFRRAVWGVYNVLNFGSSPDALDSKVTEYCVAIRERILSFPDRVDRLSNFILTLRILFRSTQKLRNSTDMKTYITHSLLEWRTFGKLVALWVTDKTHLPVIKQAWGMENLTDDIKDMRKDYQSGERKLPPSIAFYMEWIRMTTSQIMRMYEKFWVWNTTKILKESFGAMSQKYVIEPLR